MSFLEKDREENKFLNFHIGDNSWPTHFHKNIELLYVIKNQAKIILDGEEIILKENQILLIDKYITHTIIDQGKSISICLPVYLCEDYYTVMQGNKLKNFVFEDSDNLIKNKMLDLKDFLKLNLLSVKGKIDDLLGTLISKTEICKRTEQIKDDLVNSIILYLKEHYSEKITLELIAEQFNYSKFSISHKFKKETGSGINEFLNDIRLEEFMTELQKKDKSITSLIFDVGFNSVQSFYRAFKEKYKSTPLFYLRDIN